MRIAHRIGISLAAVVALLLPLMVSAPAEAASPSVVVSRVVTSTKQMALTFDVGSDVGNLSKILDALATEGVTSTFFVTGAVATTNPGAIRAITAAGHEIGNHSYSHPSFTGLTATQMTDELSRATMAILGATGQVPRPYFRPPYGEYNTAVLQTLGDAGYGHTIMWTIDTADWRGVSSTAIRDKVVAGAVPGGIVLMHAGAGAPGTPGALPGMIASLKSAGYQLVPISQLLAAASTGNTTHVVQAGDTLYRIALRYGVTVPAIAAANNITNTNVIRVGQVLIIPTGTTPPPPPPPPAPTTHTVQAGDTLYRIALRYGVTVPAIAAANNITNTNVIRVGQVLIIPTGTTPPPPPPPAPATHTVQAGDTLYRIALRYGVTVPAIAAANNITNTNVIRVGQVLIIPR